MKLILHNCKILRGEKIPAAQASRLGSVTENLQEMLHCNLNKVSVICMLAPLVFLYIARLSE